MELMVSWRDLAKSNLLSLNTVTSIWRRRGSLIAVCSTMTGVDGVSSLYFPGPANRSIYAILFPRPLIVEVITCAQAQKYFATILDLMRDCWRDSSKKSVLVVIG